MRTGTASGRPRRLTRVGVVAVLAWVFAVVVGSAIAWGALAVVDSGERTGVLSQSEVTAALTEARAPATPTPTPTAAPTPTPTVSSAPAPVPVPTATVPSAPPVLPAPTTQEVARTWTITGGVVAVSCRGAAITLLYATPSDGWTVEVGSAGPEHIEVELHRDSAETVLRASCVAGSPESQVDTRSERSGKEPGNDPSGGSDGT